MILEVFVFRSGVSVTLIRILVRFARIPNRTLQQCGVAVRDLRSGRF